MPPQLCFFCVMYHSVNYGSALLLLLKQTKDLLLTGLMLVIYIPFQGYEISGYRELVVAAASK